MRREDFRSLKILGGKEYVLFEEVEKLFNSTIKVASENLNKAADEFRSILSSLGELSEDIKEDVDTLRVPKGT